MRAAVYTRSTKDHNDVSPAAQLNAMQELAKARGLTIVQSYDDAVRKGSTEDRPAFQRLIADLKRRDRGWSHLLIYDTSRLARGRYIAQTFKHQCKRHGVTVVFGNVPEMDPVSAIIVESVLEAMDEIHSLTCRDKGLAGMAENVRRGFRAGGRAPWGYELQHEATGAIRDGRPVMKSRLVPGAEALAATAYLKARAAGVPRAKAAADSGRLGSSLVATEWSALTYAGCTVWNVHRDKKLRGTGVGRRRPREEWQVTHNTHPALITLAEAEAILTQLETSDMSAAVSAAKRAQSRYLLTEVLVAPDGRRWTGSAGRYVLRGANGRRGRWVNAADVDRAVLARIRSDLREPSVVDAMLAALREVTPEAPVTAVRTEIARLTRQRDRAARLALADDGEPYIALVAELGRKIGALEREAQALEADAPADDGLSRITRAQLQELLFGLDDDAALVQALQAVVLDPVTLRGEVTYRLSMASPGRYARYAQPSVPGGAFKVA